MRMIERLKYEFWPFLKTRLYLWWWILRYGGKKNIPKEVVFAQMAKSLERMNRNLQLARKAAMDDEGTTKEEMGEIYEAIRKAEEFEEEMEKAAKD